MQPLFYGALALAAGIAGVLLPLPGGVALLWAPLLAGLALMVGGGWREAGRRRGWMTAMALAFCCAAGYARARHAVAHPGAGSALAQRLPALQPMPRSRVFVTGYLRDSPQLLFQNGAPDAVRMDLQAASVGAGPRGAIFPVEDGIRLYAYPPTPKGSGNAYPMEEESPEPVAGREGAGAEWASALLRLPAGTGLAVTVHLREVASYHDPGVADFSAGLRRQGIGFSATLPPEGWRRWPGSGAAPLWTARARIWRWLSGRIDAAVSPQGQPGVNALARAMLLGDVDRLDAATRDNFQADGTYHLLVVAGLHVGLLVACLLGLMRLCGVRELARRATVLVLVGGYAFIIVGRTPVLRVLLMLALYLGARIWFRAPQALNAVGGAGIILLMLHPLDLFTAGFQMSLGAGTLLAGVVAPLMGREARWEPSRMRRGWVRVRGYCLHVLLMSAVLQVGFTAFNMVYFHRLSPWATVANLVLVPMAAVMLMLGWAAVILGAWAGFAAGWAGRMLLGVAAGMARWPGAGWRAASPPGWAIACFGGVMAFGVFAAAGRRRRAMAMAGACAAAVALAAIPFPARLAPGLTATVLDVGQGDSIFVSFPDGRTLLVDGGPRSSHFDAGEEIVAPFLWSLGLRRIDAVLLTHGHNDHLGGLPAVVRDFHPREIWLTRTLPQEAAMAAFVRQAEASGARIRRLSAGDEFLVGASRLEVLLPPPEYQGGEIASNDDSMVVRLSLGRESMLLEGDAEKAGEAWMLEHHLPLASQLLKVGHHGSRTSSTEAFLAAVGPRAAIISDGAGNMYGHPAPEVVARLRQDGARVFRTDLDGAIECRLSADEMAIYLFRRLPGG